MVNVNKLTPEQARRWAQYEELFATAGWQEIVKRAEEQTQLAEHRAAFASSWDENRFAMGARLVYSEIANLESTTEAQYEALVAQAEEQQRFTDEMEYE